MVRWASTSARSPWNLSPAEAVAEQKRLAVQVVGHGRTGSVRWIAGLDAAFSPDGQRCLGAAVLWDRHQQEVVEKHVAWLPLRFPYVPGLLSFREAPVLLAALEGLTRQPDLLLCDGQGRAHPRRFGLACHVGLLSGLPSIGCAKSRLVGGHGFLDARRGAQMPLLDAGEEIGRVLRTRHGVRPVYVSIGHRVGLNEAVDLVMGCVLRFRLPEPTRRADQLTKIARQAGEGISE